ncbi:MAG: hypothetical protein H8D45_20865 [Bacteroidetes bacterium]|nr:hypothetical protein [Bacteroidota bacterium]
MKFTNKQRKAFNFLKTKKVGDVVTSGEIAKVSGYMIEANTNKSGSASKAMRALKNAGYINYRSSGAGYLITTPITDELPLPVQKEVTPDPRVVAHNRKLAIISALEHLSVRLRIVKEMVSDIIFKFNNLGK